MHGFGTYIGVCVSCSCFLVSGKHPANPTTAEEVW